MSTRKIYVNGQVLDEHEAQISAMDAGFQHAVGLFETMGAYGGRVFRLDEHLKRLEHSACELGLTRDLDREPLRQAVEKTVEANGLLDARVRLTVTAGPLTESRNPVGHDAEPPDGLTIVVVATEPTVYDPAYFERGITALVGPPAANPFDATAGHKTLAYWARLRTLRQAAAAGAGEAIWLNVTNHLASGAVSNLFLVKDETLLTPFARGEEVAGSLGAPVLPGITRAVVMESANAAGLSVQRRMLSIDDLLNADEVFLTNSSWLVLPVTRIEKHTVGSGQVGPMTRRLREAVVRKTRPTVVEDPTDG